MTALGSRIRQARRAVDLTQDQLGGRLTPVRSGNAVSYWETGRDEPNLGQLHGIARATGRPLIWLLGEGSATEETPKAKWSKWDLARVSYEYTDPIGEAEWDKQIGEIAAGSRREVDPAVNAGRRGAGEVYVPLPMLHGCLDDMAAVAYEAVIGHPMPTGRDEWDFIVAKMEAVGRVALWGSPHKVIEEGRGRP